MKTPTSRLVWAWTNSVVWLWRQIPLRGGGRLVRSLALKPAGRLGSAEIRVGGLTVLVDLTNPPEEAILLWHSYEQDVVAACDRYVAAGQVAIDIGANCGVLTLALAARVGATGRVLALDPSEDACTRVREQAAANGFTMVSTAAVALGDRAAEETYRSARHGIGMLPVADEAYVTGPPETVEQRTLDEIVSRAELSTVDFIKIDTDGSEVEILDGGRHTLREHHPVLSVELNVPGLRRRGRKASDLLGLLKALDYDLFTPVFAQSYRWSARPAVFQCFAPLERNRLVSGDVFNLLAVPAGAPRP